MGSHRFRLHVRPNVLCNLGDCGQNLCNRDTADSCQGCCELCGSGARICEIPFDVDLIETIADFHFQFTNWFVAMITPILLDKSAFSAYFLFGGLALFTVAVLGACMPETRGRSLEDIQQAFHHPALGSLTSRLRSFVRRGDRAAIGTPISSSGDREDVELRHSAAEPGSVIQRMPTVNPIDAMARGLRVDAPVA